MPLFIAEILRVVRPVTQSVFDTIDHRLPGNYQLSINRGQVL